MTRRRQPPGKRKIPPLTTADLERVLKAAGWREAKGTKHVAFEHSTKPGKVNVDEKWENVKLGSWTLRSVLQQAGMSRQEFVELYWKTR